MSSESPTLEELKAQEEMLDKSLAWWEEETLKTVKITEELEKAAVYRDVEEEEQEISNKMSYLIAKGEFEQAQLDSLETKYNKLLSKDVFQKLKLKKITKKKL